MDEAPTSHVRDHSGDGLVDRELRIVDENRVMRSAHWGHGPQSVLLVSLPQVCQRLFKGRARSRVGSLGSLLLETPARPHIRSGGKKKFYVGVRKDDRANVATLEDDPSPVTRLALHVEQRLPNGLVGRDLARPHSDVRCADCIAHVMTVNLHTDAPRRVGRERQGPPSDEGAR